MMIIHDDDLRMEIICGFVNIIEKLTDLGENLMILQEGHRTIQSFKKLFEIVLNTVVSITKHIPTQQEQC